MRILLFVLAILLYSCGGISDKDQNVRNDLPIPLDTVGQKQDTLASLDPKAAKEEDHSTLYGEWSATACLEKNIANAAPAAFSLSLSKDGNYTLGVSAGYISTGQFKISGDTLSFTEVERFANDPETGKKMPMEFPKTMKRCTFKLTEGISLCFTPIGKAVDSFPDQCYCR